MGNKAKARHKPDHAGARGNRRRAPTRYKPEREKARHGLKRAKIRAKARRKPEQANARRKRAFVWMVRHGKCKGNLKGVLNGSRIDAMLDRDGVAQAKKLAQEWPEDMKPAALLSSPLTRAIATARPLAAKWRMNIKLEPLAREQDYGDYSGRNMDALVAERARGIHIDRMAAQIHVIKPPGGESWEQMKHRAARFLSKLDKEYEGKRVVVVSHSDFMNCCYALRRGLDDKEAWKRPDMKNCGIVRL